MMIKDRRGSTHDLGPNIKVKWNKPATTEPKKNKNKIEDWVKKDA